MAKVPRSVRKKSGLTEDRRTSLLYPAAYRGSAHIGVLSELFGGKGDAGIAGIGVGVPLQVVGISPVAIGITQGVVEGDGGHRPAGVPGYPDQGVVVYAANSAGRCKGKDDIFIIVEGVEKFVGHILCGRIVLANFGGGSIFCPEG